MVVDLPMLSESPNKACGVNDLGLHQQGYSCWSDCYG